jgi:hypothetical protein
VLTSGQYDDYTVEGLFRVLKSCTVKTWDSFYDPQENWVKQKPVDIIADLVSDGYLEKVDAVELGVGEYGRRSIKFSCQAQSSEQNQ